MDGCVEAGLITPNSSLFSLPHKEKEPKYCHRSGPSARLAAGEQRSADAPPGRRRFHCKRGVISLHSSSISAPKPSITRRKAPRVTRLCRGGLLLKTAENFSSTDHLTSQHPLVLGLYLWIKLTCLCSKTLSGFMIAAAPGDVGSKLPKV